MKDLNNRVKTLKTIDPKHPSIAAYNNILSEAKTKLAESPAQTALSLLVATNDTYLKAITPTADTKATATSSDPIQELNTAILNANNLYDIARTKENSPIGQAHKTLSDEINKIDKEFSNTERQITPERAALLLVNLNQATSIFEKQIAVITSDSAHTKATIPNIVANSTPAPSSETLDVKSATVNVESPNLFAFSQPSHAKHNEDVRSAIKNILQTSESSGPQSNLSTTAAAAVMFVATESNSANINQTAVNSIKASIQNNAQEANREKEASTQQSNTSTTQSAVNQQQTNNLENSGTANVSNQSVPARQARK